jgi:hypothetical protein
MRPGLRGGTSRFITTSGAVWDTDELGHLWLDENLEASDRRRFVELRDLSTWNSWDEPWSPSRVRARGRGRGLGPGEPNHHAADLPHGGTDGLEHAYRLLTGLDAPRGFEASLGE